MQMTPQTTIGSQVTLSGVGVHSGEQATVRLHPAAPDSGIVFSRTDRKTGAEIEIVANHRHVVATALSTVLGDGRFGQVATVEHLLASAGGMGVDNMVIEIDGDEVPIMDGSAEAFVEAIEEAGLRRQAANRRYIRILKPVRVMAGDAIGELIPHNGRRIEIEIDFADSLIGRQVYVFDFDGGDFRNELARARTFGFMKDVEGLWSRGFARGASLENTVVIGEGEVVNPEGLRYADEFVRHKALDAIGDLALASAPILGAYRSRRGGHRLNCAVLEALFADPDAWCWVEGAPRREAAQADVGALMPAAAYSPDVS
jgi:UDP-3-O-[3-hydroxymyristoyl] N-acetylglucosamine deacetylase